MDFSNSFEKLINYIDSYNFKTKKKFSALFFCTFTNCIGFEILKFWLTKKNYVSLLKKFFSDIYTSISMNEYEISYDKNKIDKYDKVIITWGETSNLNNNQFQDKYFNVSSSETQNTLWIIIMSNYKSNIENIKNTVFFFEKKISILKKIYNFLSISLKKKFKFNFFIDSSFFTQPSFFSIHILEKIKPFFNNELRLTLMPYENQPFQSLIINYLKKNFLLNRTIGYIHSFPSFPSHFLKSENSPNNIILNSNDQKFAFKKYLKWGDDQIEVLPSTRFFENKTSLKENYIYLPIDFTSSDEIISNFKKLVKIERNINFSKFKIRNHPAANKSKKHLKLINDLNAIIEKEDDNHLNSCDKTAVFIGSTGAIIEALKHNFKVIHITENSFFDLYHSFIWPSIDLNFINEKIVKYKIKNFDSILFNKENKIFNKYLLS